MKQICNFCGGDGIMILPGHASGCTGERCVSECPIPIQEHCDRCGGCGYIFDDEEEEDINESRV